VLSSNSFQRKSGPVSQEDSDLVQAQLNLSVDKGPPQSTDTWDPVIPDILVHDEDQIESMGDGNANDNMHDHDHHHDEEEEKIVSAYQILNLIIPDISEAAAAAEAAEQLELEQQQQQQQQLESEQDPNQTTPPMTVAITVGSADQPMASAGGNGSEMTMNDYLKANVNSATDYLAASSLGLGTGFIPPSLSNSTTRPGTPLPAPTGSSTTNLTLNASTPPATLAQRFRLPFSSKGFVPPSRPASVHQLNQQQAAAGAGATSEYKGSEGLLGINNPLQLSSTTNLNNNNGSGIRSSFFDYRLTNLLQFAGSSIAPSIRSFDLNRNNGEGPDGESKQEFYEVEFNVPPDPAQEEARRMDHTAWGRVRKMLRSGFPGRDLDPKTRKPRYKYPTNNIKTTKYTLVTFLPVNLLFQVK